LDLRAIDKEIAMPAVAIRTNLSRDDLESLLRLRKLDHTLTSAFPFSEPSANDVTRWLVPTGIAGLDACLQGGIPRGHLSECVGPRSSGRLAVMVSALAEATKRGEAVALVDPLDMFDPVSASASGIDLARMLWIRGQALSSARVSLSCEYGTLRKSLDGAVKALNLVLQAGASGFGLVVLDLAEIAPQTIKRLPFTTWLRLHRVIEGGETACVLIGAEPIARSAGGVTIQLTPGSGLRAPGLSGPEARSPKSEASQVHTARVVRARAMETRDVRVPLSAPAC
jgi:RecA DNA recombination protein